MVVSLDFTALQNQKTKARLFQAEFPWSLILRIFLNWHHLLKSSMSTSSLGQHILTLIIVIVSTASRLLLIHLSKNVTATSWYPREKGNGGGSWSRQRQCSQSVAVKIPDFGNSTKAWDYVGVGPGPSRCREAPRAALRFKPLTSQEIHPCLSSKQKPCSPALEHQQLPLGPLYAPVFLLPGAPRVGRLPIPSPVALLVPVSNSSTPIRRRLVRWLSRSSTQAWGPGSPEPTE